MNVQVTSDLDAMLVMSEHERQVWLEHGSPDTCLLGTCVLCEERVWDHDDPAEMHDPAMYDKSLTEEERMVAAERVPSCGICHAQCGLDRGWVVS